MRFSGSAHNHTSQLVRAFTVTWSNMTRVPLTILQQPRHEVEEGGAGAARTELDGVLELRLRRVLALACHLQHVRVLREVVETLPRLRRRETQHLEDFVELVLLERRVRALHLLATEQLARVDELGEDAADGPQVHRLGVVLGAEQQLRRAVPQRHDHALHVRQRFDRLLVDARQSEVWREYARLDGSSARFTS